MSVRVDRPSDIELLIQVHELVKASGFFEWESEFEWITRLNRLQKQGWLYTAFAGERLMAVAGAFRIPEWRNEYRDRLPDQEEGSILYIPFFISRFERMTDPLKLLHQFLHAHPDLTKVIFHRKKPRHAFSSWNVSKTHAVAAEARDRLCYRRKLGIIPPALVPA